MCLVFFDHDSSHGETEHRILFITFLPSGMIFILSLTLFWHFVSSVSESNSLRWLGLVIIDCFTVDIHVRWPFIPECEFLCVRRTQFNAVLTQSVILFVQAPVLLNVLYKLCSLFVDAKFALLFSCQRWCQFIERVSVNILCNSVSRHTDGFSSVLCCAKL